MYLSNHFTLVMLSVVGAVRSLVSSLVAYAMSGLISANHKSLPIMARYILCSFLSSGSGRILETVLVPVVGDGFEFFIPHSFNKSVTYAVGIATSIPSPLCFKVRPKKSIEVLGFQFAFSFQQNFL